MPTRDEIFEAEMNAAIGVVIKNRYSSNVELQRFKRKAIQMARAAGRKRFTPPERKLVEKE